MSDPHEALTLRLGRLERRIEREVLARAEAERLLESKSLELYQANQRLLALNADLEHRVRVRTEDLERERQIAIDLAEHDHLTGLANRAMFQSHLESTIARCMMIGEQCALLFIDLDRFKTVNDQLGHAAGDALLVQVAARLHRLVRGTDLVARFGGDEFAVLLSNQQDGVSAAKGLAVRIADSLAAPYLIEGLPVASSCSIGFAALPVHATSGTDLMRYADLALYAAKAEGRGRVACFDPSMLALFEERNQLEEDLLSALDSDQIFVLLQPIVETGTERIVAAEVLARWRHPTRGMISPELFISIAEERGLIETLGRKLLRAGCSLALPFLRSGAIRRISVNVSPLQLLRIDLVEQVAAILHEYGLHPSQLLLR